MQMIETKRAIDGYDMMNANNLQQMMNSAVLNALTTIKLDGLNLDNLTQDTTGMSQEEHDVPRKLINVGTAEDGTPIKKSVYGKSDSDLQIKIAQTLLDFGVIKPREEVKKTNFKAYADDWFSEHSTHLRENSAEAYKQGLKKYIIPYFGTMNIEEIDRHTVNRWIQSMYHLSRESIVLYLRIVRMILNSAVEDEIIAKNPAKSKSISLPPPSDFERETIPKPILEKTLDTALHLDNNKKKYLYLLAYTGMRKGEALGLKWEDIDFINNEIHIRHSAKMKKKAGIGPTKTRSSVRTIPLPQTLKAILEPLKGKKNHLIVGDCYTPMSNKTYENWMNTIREDIPCLKGYSAHNFRHTFLTMLSTTGKPIATVQNQAGHSSPAITLNRYIHKDQDSIRSVASTADAWMNIHSLSEQNIHPLPLQ